MNRYTVAGITDERDTCDCCGKTGLKRVVVLLDLDTREFVFYGTSCAARNTGNEAIATLARSRGKAMSPSVALAEHHERRARAMDHRASSILHMANGRPDSDTRAEAGRYFAQAVEARKSAAAARASLHSE